MDNFPGRWLKQTGRDWQEVLSLRKKGSDVRYGRGDTIQVTVKNDIVDPEEGTSIHWHGLLQKNSP